MKQLAQGSSVFVYWDDLCYLESALLASPEANNLAAPVTQHLQDFDGLLQKDLSTRRGVVQQQAHAAIADLALDETLRDLNSALLAEVRQDRKAPLFVAVMGEGPFSKRLQYALERQLKEARAIAANLGLSIVPASLRDRFAPALKARIDEGQAVFERRGEAHMARTQARLDIETWKQDANSIRRAVFGELVKLAAEGGHEATWPDAFFRVEHGSSSEPSPADPT
jgi:hypothetical protein